MNLSNACDSLSSLKLMVMRDGCLRVEYQDSVLTEFCCLNGLSYPLDGFSRVLHDLKPFTTHLLFDNLLDQTSPYDEKQVVRGFMMYVTYSDKDANGEELSEDAKNVLIIITDKELNSFTIPCGEFFSILNNTATTDKSKLINKIEIVNEGNFTATISALLLTGDINGVVIKDFNSGC